MFRPSSAKLTAIYACSFQCVDLIDSVFVSSRITGSLAGPQTLSFIIGPLSGQRTIGNELNFFFSRFLRL